VYSVWWMMAGLIQLQQLAVMMADWKTASATHRSHAHSRTDPSKRRNNYVSWLTVQWLYIRPIIYSVPVKCSVTSDVKPRRDLTVPELTAIINGTRRVNMMSEFQTYRKCFQTSYWTEADICRTVLCRRRPPTTGYTLRPLITDKLFCTAVIFSTDFKHAKPPSIQRHVYICMVLKIYRPA